MEISSQPVEDFLEVKAKGRLDGYWADHLTQALEEIMRQGHDRIRMNLSEVSYVSSLGIRVLVVFYKKLSAINGAFVVSEPSLNVRRVLDMVGLRATLMAEAPAAAAGPTIASAREIEKPASRFKVFSIDGALTSMQCRSIGSPAPLDGCRFTEPDCHSVQFPDTTIAIGLGAFGHGFEECRGRFGEFLAVAGAAAYLPSDGSNVPDFLLAEGDFVPELQVLYGACCEGSFTWLARFDTKPDAASVGLTEVADACLEISGAAYAAVVMIAESAGLAGAALRRSPTAGGAEGAPFA
ncbi:MAG: STAS domain-containing protein, partial [Bryobacteraceae bacterium]